MNVPVVILTYNRPEFLSCVIKEHDRVNTPKPIMIFDDGSDNLSELRKLGSSPDYVIFPMRHMHYRNQFVEIGKILGKLGHKYFVFTEDDASFAINWYQWGIKVLTVLDGKYDVGALSFYSGHDKPNGNKVLPNVYNHTDGHFYGTCGIVVNTAYMDLINATMLTVKDCGNPDISIRKLSIDKKLSLFVVFPNIVQHEGVGKSLVSAPTHHSKTFLGNDKDVMKELPF